ncbi:hypothetical protein [Enhygromyxa salina]|nr:hypothetical protein [Enhygromyxa salina]
MVSRKRARAQPDLDGVAFAHRESSGAAAAEALRARLSRGGVGDDR